MEHTYQYAWVIPLLPLPVILSMGFGLFLIPIATKNFRRIWAFPSVLLLSIAMVFSVQLSIQQINGSSIYQYLWSWTINNDFSLEFGYLIDPLTSIMLMLITTVGILVLIYSDGYMSHDEGYLRFFIYISFFNISMLGLVTSSNLIQIYFFWELVGMCSYLLIGFWFTRPIAASACQKAFVTNRIGDFGLLLGILGFFWITGSLEFRDLFQTANNWIPNNGTTSLLTTLCAFLLFLGAVAKSAQFPLHVWLPDAMEGPTPISALIHAATMVAAGIFLLARLLPLFISLPLIMTFISLVGTITLFLGATLALAQRDIKRTLAYSTMSQLGYMMLALGIGSYQAALFHLITHAYSKALLFLGSGSIIHSMEPLVGYSPDKSQNMALMGGLRKYIPITRTAFLWGTLSICGIPPLACFWSKDEILSNSWLYSPFFGIIASFTAGLTAFYMFRIYLLTFDGYFRFHFQNYSSTKEGSLYSISLWGNRIPKGVSKDFVLSTTKSEVYFFSQNISISKGQGNTRNRIESFSTSFGSKNVFTYPHETGNTMLFPLLILLLFTFFIGFIGIPFDNETMDNGIAGVTILSKWLIPSINFTQESSNSSINSYEFITNAISSVSLVILGLFIAYIFYGSAYSFFQNLDLQNSFYKGSPKKNFFYQVKKKIYSWSYNRGYIDIFYSRLFTLGIRGLTELTEFFDKGVIDGITNGVGLASFCIGEEIKYVGGGRISSYLFFFLCYVSVFLFFFLS
ncbi:NADH dehydrogenase subunit 5 (chloroplast) [Brachypodium distachyon]|jgi:NAD(P)H-quinone oxidoreductase subunit 5|uniref:NAD(P)H-quinone oxidoreductase subunit 5, chloroplastic n=3 Tax=Brachypodium distachyon TaxID=15368 RepID=NU5C_BRADI|nr:NADH dehydrogenase subunit 5 [Brachypodium distachyon]B3TN96.1 RecName: Full=NAD(P)H-quinone oxidoreductase subunit 5, chloroplastic; AltName: Full=NAD(P)H dehydrogenase subunit 5; AltName: Full=NADH-plastoquinone oxidoreductase subunit 5 [Brachypodium distachyon]ACF08684.1 NADH dehydrogenase subunit 5 [Brachypodium distachyon]UDU84334.1 NADH dehydrogenase subunit 5 [Brachypodium distachyon]SAP09176.1 NADH dehydrogenase subunit 5 [Brachypodium distachyon]SAP09339.1 NADH dehydrogenase subuni|eukprot:YP_002000532.1 NADH dehydrogenase subunit 5 (chloroplast) [Brachypodium distachyon]